MVACFRVVAEADAHLERLHANFAANTFVMALDNYPLIIQHSYRKQPIDSFIYLLNNVVFIVVVFSIASYDELPQGKFSEIAC